MTRDEHTMQGGDPMATLTLPGTIPGLLRRCSPVLIPVSSRVQYLGRKALFIGHLIDCDGGQVAVEMITVYPLEMIALDLTDATGRAHAAWWLAAKFPRCRPDKYPPAWRREYDARNEHACRMWSLSGYGCAPFRDAYDEPFDGVVPSLANLDPDDPRTLPDGSRWVDAEALRRVCIRVAGLEVTP